MVRPTDDDYGQNAQEPCDWYDGPNKVICHACYHWECQDCGRVTTVCECRDADHDYYY